MQPIKHFCFFILSFIFVSYSFAIEAITEVEDEYLGKWLEQRLDTTMGPRPQGSESAAVAQKGGPAGPMTQATFAADIGKGVAFGLKALGGLYHPGT